MAICLETEQEIKILKVLDDQDIFSAGCARVCLNCTKQILEIVGYDNENPDNYILKLACGAGGLKQTQAEIKCFLEHKYAPLAKILAYGRYIEIMERVDVCDYSDMADDYDEDCSFADYLESNDEEYSDDEKCRMAEQAWEAIGILTRVFGYTADNGQLGINSQGKVVAYDYGYQAHVEFSQVSDLTEYVSNNIDTFYVYINGLIGILRQEDITLSKFEDVLITGNGALSLLNILLLALTILGITLLLIITLCIGIVARL